MPHQLSLAVLSWVLSGCLVLTSWGKVDTSATAAHVVTAFPELKWPDAAIMSDSGLPRDPRPIVITGAGDGSNRIFVATQYGTIYHFPNDPGVTQMQPFLDIQERVMPFKSRENEEGFLGLAFHPNFAENGEFFVYYSCAPTPAKPHLSRFSRFRCADVDHLKADPASEEILLEIDEPYWNHNGGTVVFGPDGYLYIVVGDGGAFNDPHMNGQNLHALLGKILRIDVDHTSRDLPYAIPTDNPFAGQWKFARGEIWAYGVRNPWRISFDRETGTCWAGDVGQDTWEEIDIIERGVNYGWNLREGRHKFGPGGFPPQEMLREPIWEYHHEIGKSITGGHVYRGTKIPELVGSYLYADYVSGQVWALTYDFERKEVTANRTIRAKGTPVITFGEDDYGEVYFTSEREILTFAPGE